MLPSTVATPHLDPLACPVCRGALYERPSSLACPTCGLRYPAEHGVYLLGPSFRVQVTAQTFASDRLRRLLRDAETLGWEEARARFSHEILCGELVLPHAPLWERVRARLTAATWEDTLQDLDDPARIGWKFLLDLSPDARVLVLGPSWGAVPLGIARTTAHVVVLDGALDRLRVVAHQAISAGLDNVTCARVLDPLRLPLADASVDAAVVPGLGDWFDAVLGRKPAPPHAGSELLHELRRILVAGGQIYLAANRWPGWLVDQPARRGVRYTPRTLKRAAAAAGFAGSRLYAPFPFRHKYHQIIALDRTDSMQFSADVYRARGRALRWLVGAWDLVSLPARVRRHLYSGVPSIAAVLSTDPDGSSFAERIIRDLGAHIPPAARIITHYFVRPKGVAVLIAGVPGDGGAIVRVPLDDRGEQACSIHHRAVETLSRESRIPRMLRTLFPTPIATGTYERQRFFVESALPGETGRRYYSHRRRRYDRAIVNAAEVLSALRRATEQPVKIDATEFDRLCGRWLGELLAFVRGDVRADLEAIQQWLERTLIGTTVPLGWHHGDYDLANLLYGPDDAVTAILDFEAFDARGLPLVDLLVLLTRRLIRRHGLPFGTVFVRASLTRTLPPLEAELFAREQRRIGADERLCRAMALCCWLNHLRLRRDTWLVRSPSWLESNLHEVVVAIRRTL